MAQAGVAFFSAWLRLTHFFVFEGGEKMADMGTREAAELWGVSQECVRRFCYQYCQRIKDGLITQDKKGSPYHIPKDFPNPFLKNEKKN